MEPYDKENYRILSNYFMKIFMSGPGPGPGSFALYEKDHRARLTKTFVRLSAEIKFPAAPRHRRDVVPTQVPKFPQLPAEIVPTIVAYGFHTGCY